MVKSYGANIRCAFPGCGVEPWPSDPSVRETFNLTRYGPNGLPSDSPAPGEWRCEEHPIASQDAPTKRVRATPTEALTDVGNILEAEIAGLEEAASERGGAGETAITLFRREVERALSDLRKALTPQKPAAASNGAPGNRRPPSKLKAIERLGDGQQDWVAGDAGPVEAG
jgi:hypothetical protein